MERMVRPRMVVVDPLDMVPPRNWISPPPNCFTHVLERRQAFYYEDTTGERAAGHFSPGDKVVLLTAGPGPKCWVADSHGLHVFTARKGLRRLPVDEGQ